MKVLLDTNVLVSAVATRGLCADILQTVIARHQLLVGPTVRAEVGRVLRDKFRVPEAVAREFETFLRREATTTPRAGGPHPAVRDPDDALVLAEAVVGGAEVLVTGDRDLLDVVEPPMPILTPRAFWEQLRAADAE